MTMLFTTGLTYKKRRHFSQVCDTSPLWWVQTHFGIRVSAMPYTEYDFEYRSPQWDTSSWATMAPDFNRLIRSHHTAQSASHVSRFVIFLVLKIIFYSLARQSKKTSPKMTRAIHLRPLPSPSCRVSQTACNPWRPIPPRWWRKGRLWRREYAGHHAVELLRLQRWRSHAARAAPCKRCPSADGRPATAPGQACHRSIPGPVLQSIVGPVPNLRPAFGTAAAGSGRAARSASRAGGGPMDWEWRSLWRRTGVRFWYRELCGWLDPCLGSEGDLTEGWYSNGGN